MGKNSVKTEKRKRGKPFKKGQSGNPKGRPLGTKNFSTLYKEAIIKIAKSVGKTPEELEIEIVEQGLRKARNGDIRFYIDTMDRLHGKAQQKVDHTTQGEKIQSNQITFTNFTDDAPTGQ